MFKLRWSVPLSPLGCHFAYRNDLLSPIPNISLCIWNSTLAWLLLIEVLGRADVLMDLYFSLEGVSSNRNSRMQNTMTFSWYHIPNICIYPYLGGGSAAAAGTWFILSQSNSNSIRHSPITYVTVRCEKHWKLKWHLLLFWYNGNTS